MWYRNQSTSQARMIVMIVLNQTMPLRCINNIENQDFVSHLSITREDTWCCCTALFLFKLLKHIGYLPNNFLTVFIIRQPEPANLFVFVFGKKPWCIVRFGSGICIKDNGLKSNSVTKTGSVMFFGCWMFRCFPVRYQYNLATFLFPHWFSILRFRHLLSFSI